MKRKVINAGKLRLSPNEEAFILKEDYERRRKLRLLQVKIYLEPSFKFFVFPKLLVIFTLECVKCFIENLFWLYKSPGSCILTSFWSI